MDIEIVKWKRLSSGGALKAFASVRLGAMTLHDFRVIQQPGQEAWVSPPQKEVTVKGERKWYPLVEFTKESTTWGKIQQLLIAEYETDKEQNEERVDRDDMPF